MQPNNSLSTFFEDILFAPMAPDYWRVWDQLRDLGYRSLSVSRTGMFRRYGGIAFVKVRPEYQSFIDCYGSWGCHFELIECGEVTRIFAKAEQIIASRHIADIALVTDLGVDATEAFFHAVFKPVLVPLSAPQVTSPAPVRDRTPAVPRRTKSARRSAAKEDQRIKAQGAIKLLDELVSQVLAASTAEGNLLKLPGTLPDEDYVRVNAVLVRIGGKWNRRRGGHVFPFDIESKLPEIVETGTFVDRKQDLQLFETPEERCELMVAELGIKPGDECLEPSAGTGRLVRAMKKRGAVVTAVEIDQTNTKALDGQCDDLVEGDFLLFAEKCIKKFDWIAMNPPFTRGQDIQHVLAAFDLLKPGGRLVAIVSEGIFQNPKRQALEFCTWLSESGAKIESIPAGAFSKSGTTVATRMIVLNGREKALAAVSNDDGPLFAYAGRRQAAE